MEIAIRNTNVYTLGSNTVGFVGNNLVDTIIATTDSEEEWNYILCIKSSPNNYYMEFPLIRNGYDLTLTISKDMLPYPGKYQAQFKAISGEEISYTQIFDFWVRRSLDILNPNNCNQPTINAVAETLPANSEATVTKTETNQQIIFTFGIPQGTTFTPLINDDGELSWTNDGDKENPPSINIKGEAATIEVGEVKTALTNTISIENSGTNTAAVFNFTFPPIFMPTAEITAPVGSSLQLEYNGQMVTDIFSPTSFPVQQSLPAYGNWTIHSTQGKTSTSKTINVDAVKIYNIEFN